MSDRNWWMVALVFACVGTGCTDQTSMPRAPQKRTERVAKKPVAVAKKPAKKRKAKPAPVARKPEAESPDLLAVKAYLAQNLDDPDYQIVKATPIEGEGFSVWLPPKGHDSPIDDHDKWTKIDGGLHALYLRYRARNNFNALILHDQLFILATGGKGPEVIHVTEVERLRLPEETANEWLDRTGRKHTDYYIGR